MLFDSSVDSNDCVGPVDLIENLGSYVLLNL